MESTQKCRLDASSGAPISVQIVDAVACREGREPVALTETLYESVDPDALDAFFESLDDPDATLTFRYHGYHVRVDGTGEITLSKQPTGSR